MRLAGVLELLATIDGKTKRPGAIGAEQVEAAAALWRDYFRPHARSVFDSSEALRTIPSACATSPAGCGTPKPKEKVTREDIRRQRAQP